MITMITKRQFENLLSGPNYYQLHKSQINEKKRRK